MISGVVEVFGLQRLYGQVYTLKLIDVPLEKLRAEGVQEEEGFTAYTTCTSGSGQHQPNCSGAQ